MQSCHVRSCQVRSSLIDSFGWLRKFLDVFSPGDCETAFRLQCWWKRTCGTYTYSSAVLYVRLCPNQSNILNNGRLFYLDDLGTAPSTHHHRIFKILNFFTALLRSDPIPFNWHLLHLNQSVSCGRETHNTPALRVSYILRTRNKGINYKESWIHS